MRLRGPVFLLFCAAPLAAHAAEGGWGLLSRAAWFAGAWMILSVAAAAVTSIWFRARARANEWLSAEILREDWLAATGGESSAHREPVEGRAGAYEALSLARRRARRERTFGD